MLRQVYAKLVLLEACFQWLCFCVCIFQGEAKPGKFLVNLESIEGADTHTHHVCIIIMVWMLFERMVLASSDFVILIHAISMFS